MYVWLCAFSLHIFVLKRQIVYMLSLISSKLKQRERGAKVELSLAGKDKLFDKRRWNMLWTRCEYNGIHILTFTSLTACCNLYALESRQ